MARIQRLKALLAADPAVYGALDDQAAAVALNADTVVVKPIETIRIYEYLTLVNKLIGIEESTIDEAKEATRALQIFDSFDITNPAVFTNLSGVMGGLVSAGLIGNTDKDFIMSIGNIKTTAAVDAGLGVIQVGEITRARR